MKTVLEKTPDRILLLIAVSSSLKKKGILSGIASFEINRDVTNPDISAANGISIIKVKTLNSEK